MDNQLNSRLNIDRSANAVRIDIRGSLTEASRPDLLHEIQRVRGMGITSPITVDLSRAAFVESSALAGLRADMNAQDMNAQDSGMQDVLAAAAPGVSLVVMAGSGQGAADGGSVTAVPYPSQPAAVPAPFGVRPLSGYSSAELLAASDSVFELLDNPSGRCGNELLAQYEAIGEELSRREPLEATGKAGRRLLSPRQAAAR